MKKYINTGNKTKLPSLDNMILYLRKPEEVRENQLERVRVLGSLVGAN